MEKIICDYKIIFLGENNLKNVAFFNFNAFTIKFYFKTEKQLNKLIEDIKRNTEQGICSFPFKKKDLKVKICGRWRG